MSEATITVEDPRADDVRALLERHLAHARATTLPEEVYALDVDALVDPAVTFLAYRIDGKLLGVGALKRLDAQHAEIKSMHTAEAARGRGVGRAILDRLLALALERGYRRVSLETGAGPAFAPARALYARAGFTPCGPFGDYVPSPNSAYMSLPLDPDPFVGESARARELTAEQLRLLWRRLQPGAQLDCFDPPAPLAVFAVIRSPGGAILAQVSAHADGTNVLIGESGELCALDDGTAEERAQQVYGAIAALLALQGDAA